MYDLIVSRSPSLHPSHDFRRCRKESRQSPLPRLGLLMPCPQPTKLVDRFTDVIDFDMSGCNQSGDEADFAR